MNVLDGFSYDDALEGGVRVIQCKVQVLIQVMFLLVCFDAKLVSFWKHFTL